jgi:tripartite-type tricarboxylate transporter receptor subunit TctC
MGLCAPAGIDPAALQALLDAFAAASENEVYKDILVRSNLVYTYLSGEDYKKMVYDKYEEYKSLFSERKQ